MIENYRNIKFFTPVNFKTTLQYSEKTFKDALQDFVNFICKEYNIKNKPIDFENIKFNSGTFSSDKNKIILNELYFEIYKNCIRIENENPTLSPAKIKEMQVVR